MEKITGFEISKHEKSKRIYKVKIEDEKGNLISKIVFTAMHKDINK